MVFNRKVIFLILFLCANNKAFPSDSLNKFRIDYYQEKLTKYLDKNETLSSYYRINSAGIYMYASAKNKLENKPEFYLHWDQLEKFKTFLNLLDTKTALDVYSIGTFVDESFPSPPPLPTMTDQIFKKERKLLEGLKIALDPGHVAGDLEMGKLEKKFIHFECDSLNGLTTAVDLSEGILTFATATLLKEKLEMEGAEVFMTRNQIHGSAYGMSFEKWISQKNIDSLFGIRGIDQQQKKMLMDPKVTERDKFRFVFKDLELKKRAEIINRFHPDFTIIIHYNVDEKNLEWEKPAKNNFNMTFVGGAFMKNDLLLREKRFEFLRMLISDDLEKSIALSSEIIASFESLLNVKTAKLDDASYLRNGCLPTGKDGVYCRNLQLTRYIHSPLVYGETLYQDNIMECKLLNEEVDKTKNKRVQQVAEAYYQGILKYVLEHLTQ